MTRDEVQAFLAAEFPQVRDDFAVEAVAPAVTTNCAIDFLRKPQAGRDLVAEARLLKPGRALAVGDVLIYSDGMAAPVARAGLT